MIHDSHFTGDRMAKMDSKQVTFQYAANQVTLHRQIGTTSSC